MKGYVYKWSLFIPRFLCCLVHNWSSIMFPQYLRSEQISSINSKFLFNLKLFLKYSNISTVGDFSDMFRLIKRHIYIGITSL